MDIRLVPCNGEPELFDPAVTGMFAEQVAPWCGYIGWRGVQLLGFGGFVAPPSADGTVEIGYLTFPAHEGSGVATAIAAGLVAMARASGAQQVVAHTLPCENASTQVLVRNRFQRNGEAIDKDEGLVWRWELSLRKPQ